MNKKMKSIQFSSIIFFVTEVAREFGNVFDESKRPLDKTSLAILNNNLQELEQNGQILLLIDNVFQKMYKNYKEIETDTYRLHGDNAWKKSFNAAKAENEKLIEFARAVMGKYNIKLDTLSNCSFFTTVFFNPRLYLAHNPILYKTMTNNIIDAVQTESAPAKTRLLTQFIQQKIDHFYSPSMVDYFFSNIDSARFKNNFNFSSQILLKLYWEKLEGEISARGLDFTVKNIDMVIKELKSLGIPPKDSLNKCVEMLLETKRDADMGHLVQQLMFKDNDIQSMGLSKALEAVNQLIEQKLSTIEYFLEYAKKNEVVLSLSIKNKLSEEMILYSNFPFKICDLFFSSVEDNDNYLSDDEEEGHSTTEVLARDFGAAIEGLVKHLEKLEVLEATYNAGYRANKLRKKYKFKNQNEPLARQLIKQLLNEFTHNFESYGFEKYRLMSSALKEKLELTWSTKTLVIPHRQKSVLKI